jgi:hypothetical protein
MHIPGFEGPCSGSRLFSMPGWLTIWKLQHCRAFHCNNCFATLT